MSGDESTTLPIGGISLGDRLESIDASLRDIKTSMAEEKTDVALIKSKLALHDLILMGACGTVGVGVIGAVLVLVLK
jgi:hypothetical protein